MRPCLTLILLFSSPLLFAEDSPPRSLDDRLEISLFAEDPLLNTPTGIDVDSDGRVWVIESNTHFPPEGYKGHPTDRLLILEDTDGDGKAEAKMFIDGFTHSMSVAVKPVWIDPILYDSEKLPGDIGPPTQVFLATRREIFLLEDTDGDDQCDKQTSLVHLETEGNYPHNGLAGFAFDGLGNMYFGFGENLGADYKIIGRDGTTYSGGGEGGNIYQVQPDGTKLKHWATGFWNPHASCVDAFGRLFSVDNDPDSLPPCRLLHIIEGGDYGYRYRNGRKGFHPFTCWNGEIPGTLPMVAGTGEAPSGILAYEHDAFPKDYLGNLIVTSWGDHRIDRFRLKRKGASFESVAEPFIVGGENFRPVGIALAPDGSLYLSDWVLREYKLHGKGRVWRIKAKEAPQTVNADQETLKNQLKSFYLPKRRLAAKSLAKERPAELQEILRQRAASSDKDNKPHQLPHSKRTSIEALWAMNRIRKGAPPASKDSDPNSIVLNSYSDLSKRPIDEVATAAQWLLPNRVQPLDASAFMRTPSPVPPLHIPELVRNCWNAETLPDRIEDPGFLLAAIDDLDFTVLYFVEAYLDTPDPFVFSEVVRRITKDRAGRTDQKPFAFWPKNVSARTRAGCVLVNRNLSPKNQTLLKEILEDPDNTVKFLAVKWIAEEHLTDLRPQVEALFNDPALTPDLFLATLAALEMLDGKPPAGFDKTPPGKHVLPILKDDTKPANVRAIALRLVDPDDPELPPELVQQLMLSDDPRLREEAIRTAAMTPRQQLTEPLLELALDPQADEQLRAEATLGLARRMPESENAKVVIRKLTESDHQTIAREALRTLRKPSGQRPVEPFESAVDAKPDPLAGRRLFFHPNGPGCYKCHTVHGRGGNIGPDLSTIGGALSREKLIESIRKPSQEVAPQFTTWTMISTAGKTYTGMIVHENKGDTVLGLKDGTTIQLKTADVEERAPQKTSVMPEKLEQQTTQREFKDLIAFLESLR